MSNPHSPAPDQHGRFLKRAEAATYVAERYGFPCSRQLLAKLASCGGGPLFRKAGRFPIYLADELDRWASERIGPAQSSTADHSRVNGRN